MRPSRKEMCLVWINRYQFSPFCESPPISKKYLNLDLESEPVYQWVHYTDITNYNDGAVYFAFPLFIH